LTAITAILLQGFLLRAEISFWQPGLTSKFLR
jgi:hypothetical protein